MTRPPSENERKETDAHEIRRDALYVAIAFTLAALSSNFRGVAVWITLMLALGVFLYAGIRARRRRRS